ncbi:phosphoadenosine phosphosulfate reductase domain-containing protein [Niabella sp. 22666]|uniref:phosphoadenosine phosphosulfate reductase domain-containing protein n=1 Tax=Niabella sp. 22666 TaxID=3453954 RepID=UPI003F84A7C0
MKHVQANILGTKRIDFTEQLDLTISSLNAYGPLHNHWAVAWSMGKDSTTLVTLLVQLILTGQISAPKSLTVLLADTRLEVLPLWIAAKGIIEKLREKNIDVKVVVAPIDDRFFVYMLGRGIAPPSNRFRWCTRKIKIDPMNVALNEIFNEVGEKILLLTGVRQGESAIRDGRIAMSCGKDGAECGQGWYQSMNDHRCSTLAPILHWRVCTVWDWLKILAPSERYGGWPTAILADAYGGDEAEEINARTGCSGCPLTKRDKGLETICNIPYWAYLYPLLGLKSIYVEMKKPQYRLRKDGQINKNGKMSKKQQRLGPLTLESRLYFLNQILSIQRLVNENADKEGKPRIDILNKDEEDRIRELISSNTWPNGWDGSEVKGDVILDKRYSDGTVLNDMFKNIYV